MRTKALVLLSLNVLLVIGLLGGCSSTPAKRPVATTSAPTSGGYVMKPYPRKGGGVL